MPDGPDECVQATLRLVSHLRALAPHDVAVASHLKVYEMGLVPLPAMLGWLIEYLVSQNHRLAEHIQELWREGQIQIGQRCLVARGQFMLPSVN